jgi:hypothetical protein
MITVKGKWFYQTPAKPACRAKEKPIEADNGGIMYW